MRRLKCFLVVALFLSLPLSAQPAAWELVRENFWGKIAIDPTNSDIIYVSPGNNEQYGLHKSLDGGKTWVYYDIEYGPEDGGILIDPNNPQRLWIYGGPFKGLVRSEDGGMTVVRADTGISSDHHGYSVYALAYDHVRKILYAGDNALVPGGIYRSLDSGRRWQLVHAYGSGLMFDPTFLFVEEGSGWVYCGSTAHGIWRSQDFGLTWALLHPAVLAGQSISFLARVPNSRTMYAVGGLGKIFKSYDLGENWIRLSTATTDSSELTGGLIVSSLDTNYVYVGARAHGVVSFRGGFLISRDGGKNWEFYHKGLPQYELFRYTVWSLAQTRDSRYIYMSLFAGPHLGFFKLSQTLLTSVDERPSYPLLQKFVLQQNFPNPFNAQTRIEFVIASKRSISLDVYGISGENIMTLFQGQKEAGNHFVIWNGKNSKGGDLASGIYLCRLKVGSEILIRKMLLIR